MPAPSELPDCRNSSDNEQLLRYGHQEGDEDIHISSFRTLPRRLRWRATRQRNGGPPLKIVRTADPALLVSLTVDGPRSPPLVSRDGGIGSSAPRGTRASPLGGSGQAAGELEVESCDYSTPVLGLIFLRYADIGFARTEEELKATSSCRRKIGAKDYQARGVLYLPDKARFSSRFLRRSVLVSR